MGIASCLIFVSLSFSIGQKLRIFFGFFPIVLLSVFVLVGNCVCVCGAREQIESLDNSNGVRTKYKSEKAIFGGGVLCLKQVAPPRFVASDQAWPPGWADP